MEDETKDQQPTPPSGNSEAAKYRVRLREAEAERDALAAKLAEHETAEHETAVATARTEHAERIGTPGIAEHLIGDSPEDIAADADRLKTITQAAIAEIFTPGSPLFLAATELINEDGHEVKLTLSDALELAGNLSTILEDGDPAAALEEFVTDKGITLEGPGPAGPFVGSHLPGVRRQLSSGDIPKQVTIGEALTGFL